MNGNVSTVLLLLDSVISQTEEGFVACERCGDQEETKNLDFVDDLKLARDILADNPPEEVNKKITPSWQGYDECGDFSEAHIEYLTGKYSQVE